jgi:hypothetical protein
MIGLSVGADLPDLPNDADLEHLLNLLDLLPGPEDREFWSQVGNKGYRHPDQVDRVEYIFGNLRAFLGPLQRTPIASFVIPRLAEYLLMFFGEDCPPLWNLLDQRLPSIPLPSGMLGQRWANDLCDTAWRLYVRYSADGSWREKWTDDPI